MTHSNGPLRVGIGGPVGSGKTTLTEKLCKAMRDEFSIADIANLYRPTFTSRPRSRWNRQTLLLFGKKADQTGTALRRQLDAACHELRYVLPDFSRNHGDCYASNIRHSKVVDYGAAFASPQQCLSRGRL